MGTTLSSMLNHDKVVGWEGYNPTIINENVISIDVLATRLAVEAAEKLKKSRDIVNESPISIPTWTGRKGKAGGPNDSNRFGKITKSCLNMIRGVKNYNSHPTPKEEKDSSKTFFNSNICGFNNNNSNLTSGVMVKSIKVLSSEELIKDLHRFLLEKGSASTDDIMGKFKDKLVEDQPVLFKNLLHQISTFSKKNRKMEAKERV